VRWLADDIPAADSCQEAVLLPGSPATLSRKNERSTSSESLSTASTVSLRLRRPTPTVSKRSPHLRLSFATVPERKITTTVQQIPPGLEPEGQPDNPVGARQIDSSSRRLSAVETKPLW
jgi:hypothetical protein